MKKKILIIVGSATKNSSNLVIAKFAQEKLMQFDVEIIEDLAELPHFRTELTENNTPSSINNLREKIEQASAVIFSSPEYIFSIPSGLKNLLEWCVSTVLFSHKPIAIITASTNGDKSHEELQLIMKTLGASFDENLVTLIQGIKGRVEQGKIEDETQQMVENVVSNLRVKIEKNEM